MSTFRYVPPQLLAGQAHVVIDGAPRRGTAYTLSHWPHTPTPAELDADLSTEIVRQALHHPESLPPDIDVASIDHYDVDGVVALALLVLDGLDAAHGPLLVEAARVGDFDVVTDPGAAIIAFALNALTDANHGNGTAQPASVGTGDALEQAGTTAGEALGILRDLVDDPQRFESLWRPEWDAYEASTRALGRGWATIEEVPELDLAVVRVDPDHATAAGATWESAPLHRAAVHTATPRLRVATLAAGRMEFHYRYESWVRLRSRRPVPRVDLERLAHDLTAAETSSGRWRFDGAASVSGALHLVGGAASTIEPERFVDMVASELARLDDGPPAWDPYRPLAQPR